MASQANDVTDSDKELTVDIQPSPLPNTFDSDKELTVDIQPSPLPNTFDSENKILTLDLESMTYNKDGMNVFKSSAFLNPHSKNLNIWNNEFEDHNVIRLFHIFELESHKSIDVKSFKSLLEENKDVISQLIPFHEKFIVVIGYMPKWLSVSDDLTVIEGWIVNANTHSPSDFEKWNMLIRETVLFFNQFDDIEIYYEIWNEPDTGYWQEGINEYLEIYKQTALTIKSINPNAKVGGAAPVQWYGKSQDGKIFNIELIKYASQNNIPLDFISWHHFSSNSNELMEAKTIFEKTIRENNYNVVPEFAVTEWNAPSEELRGTPFAAAIMAENFLGFYKAGIDIQTVAAWEDFHYDVKDFSGYGLITQKGEKKPIFYVHKIFDRLSRTNGLSLVEDENLTLFIAQSIPASTCYELVIWNLVPNPAKESLKYVVSSVPSIELSNAYSDESTLLEHIWKGQSINGKRDKEFAIAKSIHNEDLLSELYKIKENELNKKMHINMIFENSETVKIESSIAIKENIIEKKIIQENNSILFDLENNEVLYFNLCLN